MTAFATDAVDRGYENVSVVYAEFGPIESAARDFGVRVLEAGGVEMNPIVAFWMEYLDQWWHLPKLMIHLFAAYLVYYLLSSRFTVAVALLVVFLYGVIVHHNFSLISSL